MFEDASSDRTMPVEKLEPLPTVASTLTSTLNGQAFLMWLRQALRLAEWFELIAISRVISPARCVSPDGLVMRRCGGAGRRAPV
ncbi:hypothetical protein SKAU_G00292560 [Synaphobranchus kaupii]|uniref:Uncharacterized protein n=1 Tax=Synaphobranchus kaupii TaxID=118154 RepID=A0A9Q1EU26_SYNKA|nr:hypothetical protein SKAU_G00292560 [Synaphobranchus kaupii]